MKKIAACKTNSKGFKNISGAGKRNLNKKQGKKHR
jgi:hypothetical protein